MKLVELDSLASEPHIEDDLVNRVGAIFERCPALQGFSIQDAAGLPKHLQTAALEGLVVTDIGIYPELEPALTERVYDEIARPARLHLLAAGRALRAYRAHFRAAPALAPVRFINGV